MKLVYIDYFLKNYTWNQGWGSGSVYGSTWIRLFWSQWIRIRIFWWFQIQGFFFGSKYGDFYIIDQLSKKPWYFFTVFRIRIRSDPGILRNWDPDPVWTPGSGSRIHENSKVKLNWTSLTFQDFFVASVAQKCFLQGRIKLGGHFFLHMNRHMTIGYSNEIDK